MVMYCSVMFGGFNTRVGVRWFRQLRQWQALNDSFNTRVGVRWFKMMMVKMLIFIQCFNTRVGVRWFDELVEEEKEKQHFNTRVGVRWFYDNRYRYYKEYQFQYPRG